jgi:hypothetical protein
MKAIPSCLLLVIILALGLSACGPVTPAQAEVETPTAGVAATSLPLPTLTTEPTKTPEPIITLQPTTTSAPTKATQLSFKAASYRDEAAGFEVDYPADWTLVPDSIIGSRGSQALLLSPGTTQETLAQGGSRIAIVKYKWDPKHDLNAYITQRKLAWTSSSKIISELSWEMADGRQAVNFIVEGPDKSQTFILLTTIGEDYLQIAGDGNLTLIEEIARTLRP